MRVTLPARASLTACLPSVKIRNGVSVLPINSPRPGQKKPSGEGGFVEHLKSAVAGLRLVIAIRILTLPFPRTAHHTVEIALGGPA